MSNIEQYKPIVRIEIRSTGDTKECIDCPSYITKDVIDKALADSSRFLSIGDETINKADIKRVYIAVASSDIEEYIA